MATLWDKFKTTIRWIVTDSDAVVIVGLSEMPTNAVEVHEAESATGSPPTQEGDGVDIRGLKRLAWTHTMPQSADTAEIDVYVYNGNVWAPVESASLTGDGARHTDVEGFERAELVITSVSNSVSTYIQTPA